MMHEHYDELRTIIDGQKHMEHIDILNLSSILDDNKICFEMCKFKTLIFN
jgi:hypothetical protein